MKILNRGVSLAEILIALAIVSVIATMGFSFTKRTIDRAYDYYIYTGYKGLCDAIDDVKNNDIDWKLSDISADNPLNENDAIIHIAKLFSIKEGDIKNDATSTGKIASFTAPNKISYKFYRTILDGNYCVRIDMTVPSAKWEYSQTPKTTQTIYFNYYPQKEYPVIPTTMANNNVQNKGNIQTRLDLLPFYLDDEKVGRFDSNGTYRPIKYISFKEAFCTKHGRITNVNCNIYPTYEKDTNHANSIIKLGDPRSL